MSDTTTTITEPIEKTVLVESTEAPPIKVKRQMTPAQLKALKDGREKLAEKRRIMKEENDEIDLMPDSSGIHFCSIM